MTLYGDVELSQHWFRYWLVAWRQQAITWTNIDIHPRAISQEIPQASIPRISLKNYLSNLSLKSPRADELNMEALWCQIASYISGHTSSGNGLLLDDSKQLPKVMLNYNHLDLWEQTSVKFDSN